MKHFVEHIKLESDEPGHVSRAIQTLTQRMMNAVSHHKPTASALVHVYVCGDEVRGVADLFDLGES